MADANATALLTVKSDASQAIREADKLTKSYEKLRKTTEESSGGFSKMVDQAAIGLAKFNLALGGVQKAFGLLTSAIDIAVSENKMRSMERMLPTGTVDKFREATDKMIKRQDIARLSVKGMTGDFALTDAQMSKVLRTSVALSEQGFGPAADVANKLIEALGKDSVEKLDDFGIALEKTGNKAHDNYNAFKEFDEILAGSHVSEETKNIASLSAALEDFSLVLKSVIADTLNGIGSIVRQFQEYESESGFMAQVMAGITGAPIAGRGSGTHGAPLKGKVESEAWFAARRRQREAEASLMVDVTDEEYAAQFGLNVPGNLVDRFGTVGRAWEKPRDIAYSTGATASGERTVYGRDNVASLTAMAGGAAQTPGSLQGGLGSGYLNQSMFKTEDSLAGFSFDGPEDKLASLKAQLGDTSTAVGAAFSTISSGVIAAVDAAVSGSDSIGRAALKASASVMKALAVESAGRALYEGALAIGSLAINDIKGAAMHGKAAGMYALAAASMGAGSALLGAASGGGGGASSGAAGGGYARPSGGGGGGGGDGSTIIINIGEGFYGDDKKTAAAVSGAVRDAQRRGARSDYSTRFSG